MSDEKQEIVIVVVLVIGLKGAIRDFFSFLTAPRTVSNTYALVARAQLCVNHVQHIERLSIITNSIVLNMALLLEPQLVVAAAATAAAASTTTTTTITTTTTTTATTKTSASSTTSSLTTSIHGRQRRLCTSKLV